MSKIHIILQQDAPGIMEPCLATFDEEKAQECYRQLIVEADDVVDEPDGDRTITIDGTYYSRFGAYDDPYAQWFVLDIE